MALAAVIDNGERQRRVMDGGTVLGDGLNHVNALLLIGSERENRVSVGADQSDRGRREGNRKNCQKSQQFNRNPALKLYTGSLSEIV